MAFAQKTHQQRYSACKPSEAERSQGELDSLDFFGLASPCFLPQILLFLCANKVFLRLRSVGFTPKKGSTRKREDIFCLEGRIEVEEASDSCFTN